MAFFDPQAFIIRFDKRYYRVKCSRLQLSYLRRYCSRKKITYSAYYSKKDEGHSFEEFMDIVGLKFRGVNFIEVPPKKTNPIDLKVMYIALGLLAVQAIIFTILVGVN